VLGIGNGRDGSSCGGTGKTRKAALRHAPVTRGAPMWAVFKAKRPPWWGHIGGEDQDGEGVGTRPAAKQVRRSLTGPSAGGGAGTWAFKARGRNKTGWSQAVGPPASQKLLRTPSFQLSAKGELAGFWDRGPPPQGKERLAGPDARDRRWLPTSPFPPGNGIDRWRRLLPASQIPDSLGEADTGEKRDPGRIVQGGGFRPSPSVTRTGKTLGVSGKRAQPLVTLLPTRPAPARPRQEAAG